MGRDKSQKHGKTTSSSAKRANQSYQKKNKIIMRKEKFLFLIRVKSGVLGLHQKSETRTKKHHQRRPKTIRETHTKNTKFSHKHTFRSFSFGKRPKVLKQQLYESDLSTETIETITLERKPTKNSTERFKQSQQNGEARSSILHRKKSTKHSV